MSKHNIQLNGNDKSILETGWPGQVIVKLDKQQLSKGRFGQLIEEAKKRKVALA